MKFNYLLFVLFILTACNSENGRQKYVELSDFELDTTAIHDNEEIKIIYCSSLGNKTPPENTLIQFVVIRVNTNDTINILTEHSDQIAPTDGDKIFLYKKGYYAAFTQTLFMKADLAKVLKGEDGDHGYIDVNIPRVITDEKYADLGKNNYPTTYGDIVNK